MSDLGGVEGVDDDEEPGVDEPDDEEDGLSASAFDL